VFVRNRTALAPVLARGNVDDAVGVASLNVEVAYRVEAGALVTAELPKERAPADPPDITLHPIWIGVSVTASGTVRGPARPPFVRRVSLAVGAERRELVVWGDRVWRRALGGLEPGEPARFDAIPLTFARAFGGGWDEPPGLLPGTDLPHPGVRVAHPRNPDGIGFYPDEARAAGRPLPNVEIADDRTQRWNDQPQPGGFAPCPHLAALRAPETHEAYLADPEAVALRALHHAPGRLIFPTLPAGTPVRLEGLGASVLAFAAPPSPVRVVARPVEGPERREIPGEIRSLHVDADGERVTVVHAHALAYDRSRAPGWFHVTHAS
jgi:hypothetical protein